MNDFTLKFTVPANLTDKEAARTFYLPADGAQGSFETALTPRLGTLGPVNPLNADLARLALLVWAADRSVLRAKGSVNWTARDMSLTVPVSDPTTWTSLVPELEELLGFLSGDHWTLVFKRTRFPKETAAENQHPTAERVVLLSGGADSATGALLARTLPEEHLLLSHHGGNGIKPVQTAVAKRIRELVPKGSTQSHIQLYLARRQGQPNGYEFKSEPSTRTRSLLFLALGLATASVNDIPLWIPENGFASLNPAMGADQLGSVSTKTTHPWFLSELSSIAQRAGAHHLIVNPFADQTKGEIFQWVASNVGAANASKLLSLTDSCGFTGRWHFGIGKDTHCGVCFGCLMRRASFKAAKLKDRSAYASDDPPTPNAASTLAARTLMPSLRAFVARGVTVYDVATMRLPAGYAPSAAYNLCQRGVAEMSHLV